MVLEGPAVAEPLISLAECDVGMDRKREVDLERQPT
jgi:hypothetical protein